MNVDCMPPRKPDHCLCGEPLPRRKSDGQVSPSRRWCRPSCGDDVVANHQWTAARARALRRSGYKVRYGCRHYPCRHCSVLTTAPEVNHIVPLVGSHRGWSCLNHEANLEVLCHDCHARVTREQRRSRAAAAASTKPTTA